MNAASEQVPASRSRPGRQHIRLLLRHYWWRERSPFPAAKPTVVVGGGATRSSSMGFRQPLRGTRGGAAAPRRSSSRTSGRAPRCWQSGALLRAGRDSSPCSDGNQSARRLAVWCRSPSDRGDRHVCRVGASAERVSDPDGQHSVACRQRAVGRGRPTQTHCPVASRECGTPRRSRWRIRCILPTPAITPRRATRCQ